MSYTISRTWYFSLVFVAALVVRVYDISGFPEGIHGDEGSTGRRAWEILRVGWIGVFDPLHSIGQWALPQYLTAPFVAVDPDPIRAVRLPMAICGALSVVFVFGFTWNTLGPIAASLVALFLSVFVPHVVLSRVGFPPIAGFAVGSAALWAISSARQGPWRYRRLLIAGLLSGVSLFTYGAMPALIGALFLALLLCPKFLGSSFRERAGAVSIVALGAAFVIGCVALIEYDNYALRNRAQAMIPLDANVLERSVRSAVAIFGESPPIDGVDGLGAVPIFDLSSRVLILFGIASIVCAVVRGRDPGGVGLAVLSTCLGAIAGGLAVCLAYDSGFYRRSLSGLVLLLLCMAAPIRLLDNRIARVMVAVLFGVAVVSQVHLLGRLRVSRDLQWVYAPELTEASLWARSRGGHGTAFLFSAGRWSGMYETVRYLTRQDERQWRVVDVENSSQLTLELARGESVVAVFLNDRRHLVDDSLFDRCEYYQRFVGCVRL